MDRMNPSKHISHQFNREMGNARDKVLTMGEGVEQQVADGLRALLEQDRELGHKVATSDYKINLLEVEIDEECTQIIALRQPAASDLRVIITIIKTITDLERIGDQAEKLGRFAVALSSIGPGDDMLQGIGNLGQHVRTMLHRTLDAFARMDVDAALIVATEDKKINREYDGVMRQLITYMMEDPRQIKQVLHVMWCARSLERIANHSCNICEYIVYAVSGRVIRHTSIEQVIEEFNNI